MDANKPKLMMAGLPGDVSTIIARCIDNDPRVELYDFAITGPEIQQQTIQINGRTIKLIRSNELKEHGLEVHGADVIIDYVSTGHLKDNFDWYNTWGQPFVSGTTSKEGNAALEQRVRFSPNIAVMAANMGAPIVSFQDKFVTLADLYQGALEGYTFKLEESHQAKKGAETSATARAIVAAVNKLGIPFTRENIISYRTEEEYERLGIPKAFWGGHGWHTYTFMAPGKSHPDVAEPFFEHLKQHLSTSPVFNGFSNLFKGFSNQPVSEGDTIVSHKRVSPDGTVEFRIDENEGLFSYTHNVNGRDVYGPLNVDAALFLIQKKKEGERGQVYSAMDVINSLKTD